MSYTTLAYVKRIGGINEPSDFNVWRFADVSELDAAITDAMNLASAWVRRRMGSGPYAAIAGTDDEILFKHGEACAAMMFLLMNPKTRRVDGTHYALDSEGSERYEELIDEEWSGQVELALGDFFVTDSKAYARPVLMIGPSSSRRDNPDVLPRWAALQEVLDEARGLPVNLSFTEDS